MNASHMNATNLIMLNFHEVRDLLSTAGDSKPMSMAFRPAALMVSPDSAFEALAVGRF